MNIDWRKGTGLPSSPSDGGRDIECQLIKEEIDGSKYFEKWFIECKHYQKGVPPEKLQTALSWANEGRPDKLLIIVSNFLSNRAKDYLSGFINNNRPNFRILYWEQPDLGTLLINKPALLNKYKIARSPYLYSMLHPIHLKYMSYTYFNSVGYLFDCLNQIDNNNMRDIILIPAYKVFMSTILIDNMYEAFQNKCYEIVASKVIDEVVLTNAIISITLQHCFSNCGVVPVEEMFDIVKTFHKILRDDTKAKGEDVSKLDKIFTIDQKVQLKVKDDIVSKQYIYNYFCDTILSKLLLEPELEIEKMYGIKLREIGPSTT